MPERFSNLKSPSLLHSDSILRDVLVSRIVGTLWVAMVHARLDWNFPGSENTTQPKTDTTHAGGNLTETAKNVFEICLFP